MTGNKNLSKQSNKKSFFLFFAFYAVSVLLVSGTVYHFAKIPEVAIKDYENEKRLIRLVNDKMSKMVEAADKNEGGSINTTRNIGIIATEIEKEVVNSTLSYDGSISLIKELIETREKSENSPQAADDLKDRLMKKEQEVNDLQKELDKCNKQLDVYRN